MKIPNVQLNNGFLIPSIGIGPGMLNPKTIIPKGDNLFMKFLNKCDSRIAYYKARQNFIKGVSNAVHSGYRLLDFSFAYGTGDLLMKGIINSGIKREDVIITSRVTNKQQYAGADVVRKSFFEGLSLMGLEYLDLYMFHWPVTGHFLDTYREIEKLYKEGYVKAIGVANCHEHHLRDILDNCEIVPAVNQIEVHPLFSQKPLISFCKEKGIRIEAYTPIARNDDRLYKNKILQGLAEKYHKSIPQIVLRWHTQLGLIPIPRSMNLQRQKEDINIFDFMMSDDEIKSIDSININSRLRFDPDNLDFTSVG